MIRLVTVLLMAVPPQAPPVASPPPQAPPVVAVLAPARSPLEDYRAPPFSGIGKVLSPEVVRPPVVRPAKKLPAGPTVLVPCGTVVKRVSRTFRDGSHEHVCPICGTSWIHGGRSGNQVSHVCPGMRAVPAPPVISAQPDPDGWAYPTSVTTEACAPGHR